MIPIILWGIAFAGNVLGAVTFLMIDSPLFWIYPFTVLLSGDILIECIAKHLGKTRK